MTVIKHKTIPKMKKQLKGFLTDESGKVAKEDVLKLALGTMLIISSIPQVGANFHYNGDGYAHGNGDGANSTNNYTAQLYNTTNVWFDMNCTPAGHSNNLVNGHVNYAPGVHANASGSATHTSSCDDDGGDDA